MPSDLPTTFSPGLFYLEALDYAGFDKKCSIDEVFNLISTSSEFMNSAILPQFIMKREYKFGLESVKLPFSFCNSLQFVRSLSIQIGQPRAEDEDRTAALVCVDDCVNAFSFVDFLDRSGLFNFYLRKLDLEAMNAWSNQVLLMIKHMLRLTPNLESLVIPIQSWAPGLCSLKYAAKTSLSKTLNNLDLVWVDNVDEDDDVKRATSGEEHMHLDALEYSENLESLSLRNCRKVNHRKSSFSWLTPELPICQTLKSLSIFDFETLVPSLTPLANLRSLNRLVLENDSSGEVDRNKGFLLPMDFEVLCDAFAETLTELSLSPRCLMRAHLVEVKKLKHLRKLEIIGGMNLDEYPSDKPSILDLGDLPCFDLLIELKIVNFEGRGESDEECGEYLKKIFSKMKCLELLQFHSMTLVDSFFDTVLENLHHDAPLRDVYWQTPVVNLLKLPKLKMNSVENLVLVSDSFGRLLSSPPSQLEELKRIPTVFPNLVLLRLDHYGVSFDSSFENLEELAFGTTTDEEVLYENIKKDYFPKLRKLNVCVGFDEIGCTEGLFLCKLARRKLKHLERLTVHDVFDDNAKLCHTARKIFPFVECDIVDKEQQKKEWKLYRGRRTVWDDNDESNSITWTDATGRRRQREDRAGEDLS